MKLITIFLLTIAIAFGMASAKGATSEVGQTSLPELKEYDHPVFQDLLIILKEYQHGRDLQPYILFYDLLKQKDVSFDEVLANNFGIYQFQYAGLMDGGNFILIRDNNSYDVFNEFDTYSIVKHLYEVKGNYPELMTTSTMKKYLKALDGVSGSRSFFKYIFFGRFRFQIINY